MACQSMGAPSCRSIRQARIGAHALRKFRKSLPRTDACSDTLILADCDRKTERPLVELRAIVDFGD